MIAIVMFSFIAANDVRLFRLYCDGVDFEYTFEEGCWKRKRLAEMYRMDMMACAGWRANPKCSTIESLQQLAVEEKRNGREKKPSRRISRGHCTSIHFSPSRVLYESPYTRHSVLV